MIGVRKVTIVWSLLARRAPFGSRANKSITGSIATRSRIGMITALRPSVSAAALNGSKSALRIHATRVMLGAISLSRLASLPTINPSKATNPVTVPPGWAKLAIIPELTGSGIAANTIGTPRISF
jgi:hypothetical protein